MKNTNTTDPPTTKQPPPRKVRHEPYGTYLAPPPPPKGKISGLDCHPDTFTAAVFQGTTPHDARTCERRELLHLYNKAVEDRTAAINSL